MNSGIYWTILDFDTLDFYKHRFTTNSNQRSSITAYILRYIFSYRTKKIASKTVQRFIFHNKILTFIPYSEVTLSFYGIKKILCVDNISYHPAKFQLIYPVLSKSCFKGMQCMQGNRQTAKNEMFGLYINNKIHSDYN